MRLAPLSQMIVLTEDGSIVNPIVQVVIPPLLIATLANTPIGSLLPIAALPGALDAFAPLFATSTDMQADLDQLRARFDQLEA